MSRVGDQIQALRIHKGLSQKQLAALLKIRTDVLSRYEVGGKMKNPTLETLEKIADTLEVSIDFLNSNDTPDLYFRRQELLDIADKLARLPEDFQKVYVRHIERDYDDTLIKEGHRPLYARRRPKPSVEKKLVDSF